MFLILLVDAAPWIGRDWGRQSGKASRNRNPDYPPVGDFRIKCISELRRIVRCEPRRAPVGQGKGLTYHSSLSYRIKIETTSSRDGRPKNTLLHHSTEYGYSAG